MKKSFLLLVLLICSILVTPEFPVKAQGSSDRPVVTIKNYSASSTPTRGEDFTMTILFTNSGQRAAKNIFIEFSSGELIPRDTGGMQTIYQLVEGETKGISQSFTVNADLWGASIANVVVNIEYSDYDGNLYTDSFTLVVDLDVPSYSPLKSTPTPTPTPIIQPQIVIGSYETDVEILQPGTPFNLTLEIINLGNATAKAVSMVMGGGKVELNAEGISNPGLSGSDGEFSTFAPLESSNVKFLGDISPGESITAENRIIVNVTTLPGAYSLKYSFIYIAEDGQKIIEDQVITLLVYRLPALQIGFYQEPGPIYANQPNNLPLQVMNLGKTSVVLGNMEVTADNAQLENNSAFVGPVEAGFYFTLDTMLIPAQSGSFDIHVSVNYTDDFNNSRVYEETLTLDVIEAEMPIEGPEGGMMPSGEQGSFPPGEMPTEDGMVSDETETFWQKIIRFFKGLLGLDSGKDQPTLPSEMPPMIEKGPVPVP